MTLTPSPERDAATTLALRVLNKSVAADGVVTVILGHPDGKRLPDWTPGSHIDLVLPNGITRQYSLCGDRWDAHRYRVGVLRERQGQGGSAYVHDDLEPGASIAVGGPRNNFALAPSERYLFVAGGIGITPLIPMIQQADMLDADWTLLYGGRTRSSMAFRDELAAYGDRVVLHPEDEAGRLPLTNWLGASAPDRKVYCCGPSTLLEAVEQHCADWATGLLRTERFVAKDTGAPVRNEAFDVELHRTGTTVTVEPEVSVLDAVRRAGVHVLSSCEKGTCGTCETAVLHGEPDHRDTLLDDQERAANTCMFICVSRSCQSRLVVDL